MEETRYAARLCNSILPGLVGETMSVDTPIRPQKMWCAGGVIFHLVVSIRRIWNAWTRWLRRPAQEEDAHARDGQEAIKPVELELMAFSFIQFFFSALKKQGRQKIFGYSTWLASNPTVDLFLLLLYLKNKKLLRSDCIGKLNFKVSPLLVERKKTLWQVEGRSWNKRFSCRCLAVELLVDVLPFHFLLLLFFHRGHNEKR